jgi:hypothetical protein
MAPAQVAATVRVHDHTKRRDVEPDADGNYQLRCWHDYRLFCSVDPHLPGSAGSCFQTSDGNEWIAEANFGDFIGTLALLGRRFTVTSRKLDESGFAQLLGDVARRAASLPFTSGSPALLPFERASLSDPRILYHAFVYLRWVLREARPTLHESIGTIAHDPHRALVREERTSALWDARAVTATSLQRAVEGGGTWVSLQEDNALARSPLATSVAALTGRAQVPLSVIEPIARTTRDTPENRFVRYSLDVALEIVRRVETLLTSRRQRNEWLDERLLADAGEMRRGLRRLSSSGFLADVGEMRHFPANSQVLQRRQGYRDMLHRYCGLVAASRLAVLGADMARLLETKTASTLYEYWCFFTLAGELEQLLDAPLRADKSIVADDWQTTVREGITVDFPGGVQLAYNQSYGGNMCGSYSVPLRPDITLTVGGELHLLDAKFRLQSLPDATIETNADDDEMQAISLAKWTTFQRADIHKMHAYKDALGARRDCDRQKVRSVWVLYPGDDTAFFSETRGRTRAVPDLREDLVGVGALPLQPEREPLELRHALRAMLERT